jgi:hypothetical protein
MVLTCILNECKLLCFHGFEKKHGFMNPWFFKGIGQKYHELLESHGFKEPWFFFWVIGRAYELGI